MSNIVDLLLMVRLNFFSCSSIIFFVSFQGNHYLDLDYLDCSEVTSFEKYFEMNILLELLLVNL